jgi:hypothetical protein
MSGRLSGISNQISVIRNLEFGNLVGRRIGGTTGEAHDFQLPLPLG